MATWFWIRLRSLVSRGLPLPFLLASLLLACLTRVYLHFFGLPILVARRGLPWPPVAFLFWLPYSGLLFGFPISVARRGLPWPPVALLFWLPYFGLLLLVFLCGFLLRLAIFDCAAWPKIHSYMPPETSKSRVAGSPNFPKHRKSYRKPRLLCTVLSQEELRLAKERYVKANVTPNRRLQESPKSRVKYRITRNPNTQSYRRFQIPYLPESSTSTVSGSLNINNGRKSYRKPQHQSPQVQETPKFRSTGSPKSTSSGRVTYSKLQKPELQQAPPSASTGSPQNLEVQEAPTSRVVGSLKSQSYIHRDPSAFEGHLESARHSHKLQQQESQTQTLRLP